MTDDEFANLPEHHKQTISKVIEDVTAEGKSIMNLEMQHTTDCACHTGYECDCALEIKLLEVGVDPMVALYETLQDMSQSLSAIAQSLQQPKTIDVERDAIGRITGATKH